MQGLNYLKKISQTNKRHINTDSIISSDVCHGVTCTHGSKCALDATTGIFHVCYCNSLCPQVYDPVCGSDGKDYNNECLMNVSICTIKRVITVVSKGPCPKGTEFHSRFLVCRKRKKFFSVYN